jgi:hypothetical protein
MSGFRTLRDLHGGLVRLCHAEGIDGINHRRANQALPLGRGHHQFLVAIRDRARFKQYSGHFRLL